MEENGGPFPVSRTSLASSPFFFFPFFFFFSLPLTERGARSPGRQRFRERGRSVHQWLGNFARGKESGEGPVVFAATASRKPSSEIQKSYFIEDAYLVAPEQR